MGGGAVLLRPRRFQGAGVSILTGLPVTTKPYVRPHSNPIGAAYIGTLSLAQVGQCPIFQPVNSISQVQLHSVTTTVISQARTLNTWPTYAT